MQENEETIKVVKSFCAQLHVQTAGVIDIQRQEKEYLEKEEIQILALL